MDANVLILVIFITFLSQPTFASKEGEFVLQL